MMASMGESKDPAPESTVPSKTKEYMRQYMAERRATVEDYDAAYLWTTQREINFVKRLGTQYGLAVLKRYGQIVLGGYRRFDPQIRVDDVKRAIIDTIDRIDAEEIRLDQKFSKGAL